MLKSQEIEHSIITKYRKVLWRPFMKAIRDYRLVEENDKIAVCISGGKDSMLLAKCMQELKKHGKVNISLEFIVMDPGYTEEVRKKIIANARVLDIPITIFKTDVFAVSEKLNKTAPCYMCARMRRGCLYEKAKSLGCNKIALGHHFDDVIETILLSVFYGGEYKSMPPKLHSLNFEGMELIRPLYLVREQDIIAFSKYHKLSFINCACKFTKKLAQDIHKSKRSEMKALIQKLTEQNSLIAYNIFKSSENVSLDTLLGYKLDGEKHSFLEQYDQRTNK